MEIGQLSLMIGTLKDVFDNNPTGMHLDAELCASLACGLADMERAALALEQRVLQLQIPVDEPDADNVIAFPIVPRPRPSATGGAA